MKKLFLAVATILLTGLFYQTTNAHVSLDSKVALDSELFGGLPIIEIDVYTGGYSRVQKIKLIP